jgi:transposase
VVGIDDRVIQVVIETVESSWACSACGTHSSQVKDRPVVQVKDLAASGQQVLLWWRKRRLVCPVAKCPRVSFTETTTAIAPRSRLTARLRSELAAAIAGSNRAVAEVAAVFGVAWHTAHTALITAAAQWLPAPSPTRVLGIDETRVQRVRWLLEPARWRRSDPWLTSFVDADTTRPWGAARVGTGALGWLCADLVGPAVTGVSRPYRAGGD